MYLRTRACALVEARSLRRFFVVFLGLALVQMLSGCILDSQRPPLTGIPDSYRAGKGDSAPPALDWWRGFNSHELTSLIEEAQTANFNIGAAIARIIQADAQAKVAGAPLLPALQFDGFAQRSWPPGGGVREDYKAWLHGGLRDRFLG